MNGATHLQHKPPLLSRLRRTVIKVGSSILSSSEGIDRVRLRSLVEEIAAVHDRGIDLVVVTSGAVAAGLARLGRKDRPRTVPERQAAAAVGQIDLMALYEEEFARRGKCVAQVLLTHDDLSSRRRYINAKHTLETLLQARIVPIANENDTVATEELNFGDNDNLSALVATLVEADLLLILSDVAGVFTRNPLRHPDAAIVPLIRDDRDLRGIDLSAESSPLGKGGMAAKVAAARKAAAAGIATVIADGRRPSVVAAVFDPAVETGTLVLPSGDRLAKRKHWIAYTLKPSGALVVDDGACEALRRRGGSLLPRGLRAVQGRFEIGACVRCLSGSGEEFARGLVNYPSADLEKIKGLHSSQIEAVLGYKIADEVIHRDNLALLDRPVHG